jgi:hypothetical protein
LAAPDASSWVHTGRIDHELLSGAWGPPASIDLGRQARVSVRRVDSYEITVLASWLAAILGMISVLRHSTSDFRRIGKSKGKWFLIQFFGLFPYVGVITLVLYLVKVRVHLPERPKPLRQRGTFSGSLGSSSGSSRGSGTHSQDSFRPTDWMNNQARPQPCTCNSGRVPCYGCYAGWVTGTNGDTIPHVACSGRGYTDCMMCGGKGTR